MVLTRLPSGQGMLVVAVSETGIITEERFVAEHGEWVEVGG